MVGRALVPVPSEGGVGVGEPTTQPSLTAVASSLPPTSPRNRPPPPAVGGEDGVVLFGGVGSGAVAVAEEEDRCASCTSIRPFTGRRRCMM